MRVGGSFAAVLPGAPRRIPLVVPPWPGSLQPLRRDARPLYFRLCCGGSALPCCLLISLRSTFCRLDAAIGLVREYLHTCACVYVCECVCALVTFLSCSFLSGVCCAAHTPLQALLGAPGLRVDAEEDGRRKKGSSAHVYYCIHTTQATGKQQLSRSVHQFVSFSPILNLHLHLCAHVCSCV